MPRGRLFDDPLDPGSLELDHLSAAIAHKMLVMRPIRERLVTPDAVPERVFTDQSCLDEERQGPVHGRLADRVPLLLETLQDLLGGDVAMGAEEESGDA